MHMHIVTSTTTWGSCAADCLGGPRHLMGLGDEQDTDVADEDILDRGEHGWRMRHEAVSKVGFTVI